MVSFISILLFSIFSYSSLLNGITVIKGLSFSEEVNSYTTYSNSDTNPVSIYSSDEKIIIAGKSCSFIFTLVCKLLILQFDDQFTLLYQSFKTISDPLKFNIVNILELNNKHFIFLNLFNSNNNNDCSNIKKINLLQYSNDLSILEKDSTIDINPGAEGCSAFIIELVTIQHFIVYYQRKNSNQIQYVEFDDLLNDAGGDSLDDTICSNTKIPCHLT